MVLNVIALALVAAITFMHSIFGLFSGLINVFCTIVSVVVAFAFFEPLTDFFTANVTGQTQFVEPTALFLLFVGSLIILRTAADNLIRGNVTPPAWLDTGGSIVCGFVNGQLITGVLVISVLMLPLGGRVLGFQRLERVEDESSFDRPEMVRVRRNALWTRPDEMTVGLFNWLSDGSLRGATPFTSVYPDYVDSTFYSTNTVQPESTPAPYRDERNDGFKDGIAVLGAWFEDEPLTVRYRRGTPTASNARPNFEQLSKPFEPIAGYKLLGVRVDLKQGAADRRNNQAVHLFRPTMLRLVGRAGDKPHQAVPIVIRGGNPELGDAYRLVNFDDNYSVASASVELDLYFEVPENFTPRFVEYRRHARAGVLVSQDAPEGQIARLQTEDERRAAERMANRTFGDVARGTSHDRLPFGMSREALSRSGVELQGTLVKRGRLSGEVERFRDETQAALSRIVVPEGYALVHVQYNPKKARTIVGDVFNFVGQLNQYFGVDNTAERYPMVGYYAVAQRGRGQYIEFFYNGGLPDKHEVLDPAYRNMLDFKALRREEINDGEETEVTMLFLIPAGRTLTRVQTQTGEGGDLRVKTQP